MDGLVTTAETQKSLVNIRNSSDIQKTISNAGLHLRSSTQHHHQNQFRLGHDLKVYRNPSDDANFLNKRVKKKRTNLSHRITEPNKDIARENNLKIEMRIFTPRIESAKRQSQDFDRSKSSHADISDLHRNCRTTSLSSTSATVVKFKPHRNYQNFKNSQLKKSIVHASGNEVKRILLSDYQDPEQAKLILRASEKWRMTRSKRLETVL